MGAQSVTLAPPTQPFEVLDSQSKGKFWHHPLFSLIWSSARVDVIFGLLMSPFHALTEVALGFASGALLQLIFVSSGDATLQRVLPRRVAEFFPSLAQIGRGELITLVPLSLIAIGFIRLLTSFGSNYLLERAGHRVAHSLRAAFLDSYLKASGRVLDNRNPDELTNRILLDTTLMQSLVSKGTIGALRDGLVVIAAGLSMLVIASEFFVVLILIFVPFFLILRAVARRLEYFTRESARRQVEIATRGLQMRQGLLAIFGMGAQQREKDDLSSLSEKFYLFMKQTFLLRTAFRPGMEILAIAVLAMALQWRFNLRTEADVAGYSTLFVLAALSFRPLKNVSSFVSQFAELKAVWKRLANEWNVNQMREGDRETPAGVGFHPAPSGVALDVRGVAYDAFEGRRILHPCHLTIKQRSRVALVGESGAGKSTLLRLMAGLLPPTEGVILGSENVLLATQTAYVFQGTVFENIVYPALPKHSSEVQRVRERAIALVLNLMLAHTQAGAELFLNKKVGFMGDGLSGGERARVALARLLFADKPILLLDEPTANLDAESSTAFWSAVWKWQQQAGESRTVIAVTHHLKDLSSFDECHLFSQGRLVSSGTPEQILAARQSLNENRGSSSSDAGTP